PRRSAMRGRCRACAWRSWVAARRGRWTPMRGRRGNFETFLTRRCAGWRQGRGDGLRISGILRRTEDLNLRASSRERETASNRRLGGLFHRLVRLPGRVLLEQEQAHAFRQRRYVSGQGIGLHALTGDRADHVAGPGAAERDALAG